MQPIDPFDSFHAASSKVLKYLHAKLGFGLWMVTRVEGDNWIVLKSEDNGYRVQAGDVFCWADSFCSQMVLDRGPRIAPRSMEIPVYAAAPIGNQVPIGAYIGVPLTRADGSLFGTLCAIDPEPKSEEITAELPLIEMLARLLVTILEAELKAQQERRRAERAEADSMTDALTGLYNRRGWDKLLEREDNRCRRYGHPACVVSIDLDDLKVRNDEHGHAEGDFLLRRLASTLTRAARGSDVVARVGGDEFAILAIECDLPGAEALFWRLESYLKEEGIAASVGFAMRDVEKSLCEAWQESDRRMYACKRERKGQPLVSSEAIGVPE